MPLVLVLLAGCDRLQQAGETVEGSTSPLVAQGIFLGLDAPEGVDLSDAEELGYTALCSVFLAEVTDAGDITDAPIEGGEIALRSPANGALEFEDEGEGKYTLDSSRGLVYEVGETAVISLAVDDDEGKLVVETPEAPDVDVPEEVKMQTGMVVDLSDYAYENALAAVYDLTRGRMTWDSLPDGVDQTYEFTHPEEPADQIVIPAEAFLRKGNHVVGVAGMEIADVGAFEGVNTQLSALMAGRVALHLVVVTD
ncbi:MAG: hypothetical protein ACOZNI_30195 [Myxococcota bacterium]